MLFIKELKLPRPVLTKELPIETMLVAALYQAIAFLQIPFNRKVLSWGILLSLTDYVVC